MTSPKDTAEEHTEETSAPNSAPRNKALPLTVKDIDEDIEERVRAEEASTGNPAYLTENPSGQTADAVILGELYWRFVNGTFSRCLYRRHSKYQPPREDEQKPSYELTPITAADVAAQLRDSIKWAEIFWLDDELERRRDELTGRNLFGPARLLKREDVTPTMELARRLFDHPRNLPSFCKPGTAIDASPYHVLVWFHFKLYPSLVQSFLAGVFPGVRDLPLTILGISPVNPRAESDQAVKVRVADEIQLEDPACKILRALGNSPTRLKQADLRECQRPRMSPETVSRHLHQLKRLELIDWNPRDKRGATILPKGRAHLTRLS